MASDHAEHRHGVRPSSSPDGPTRQRVLAYVADCISAHRLALVSRGAWKIGREGAIAQLSRELALMQTASTEGHALFKTWALLIG